MARITDMDPAVRVETRTLERLRVAVRASLSAQLAHDASFETHRDMATDSLIMQLGTEVLAEKLITDDQFATYERVVTVEQPAPRFIGAPQAALILAATVAGLIVGSVLLVLFAALLALATIISHAANPPRTHERTVTGSVTIPITSYAKFPENQTVYPKDLGRPVRYQQVGSPLHIFVD